MTGPGYNGSEDTSGSPSLFTDEVRELVAIGAAVAGNCERCFIHHHEKATRLGISKQDMLKAASLGSRIREAPSQILADLVVDRLVAREVEPMSDSLDMILPIGDPSPRNQIL